MKYANREMKIDQIIDYFNHGKINLIPPFQRGTVWTLRQRRELIENMVKRRPIPAIFLYKEEAGAKYAYNILDGKQRLESLILFVGNGREDMRVNDLESHFYGSKALKDADFSIDLDGTKASFRTLPDDLLRKFREYTIPTIEIDLDEESTQIDEIIKLFVDINQKGEKVGRFDVRKGSLLSVRFSAEEREALDGAAERDGESLSNWARRTLLAAVSSSSGQPGTRPGSQS